MSSLFRHTPLAALALAILAAGCSEAAEQPAAAAVSDSALANDLASDLALAQRSVPPQVVFNDAPLGGAAPAGRASAGRAPVTAAPRPSPRRAPPRAPLTRSPRAPDPAPVEEEEEETPTPATGPARARAAGVIGAGSRVGMVTNSRVCTAGLLPGDKFTATVSAPTMGSNGAVIPAGATVVLEVAAVDRADPVENSRIDVRIRTIDVDGVQQGAVGDVAVLAPLDPVRAASGNDRTRVIGGAVAGAVIGRILGKSTKATVIGAATGAAAGTAAARSGGSSEACLPTGSALRLTLSRDLVMKREGEI